MKYVFLVCLIIGLFCIPAFSQTETKMIDVEFDFFGGRPQYSVSGKKLLHKDLELIIENFSEPKAYFDKATKRKKVAVPLLSIGGAGMITSLFLSNTDSGAPVFWSSFGVFMVGVGYFQGYIVNLQKSVNTYNQSLFNSGRTRSSLDLKISPTQTGFIYSF